ncbi:hypothetical protein V1503_24090 [Bacillus sp. SCS-151]
MKRKISYVILALAITLSAFSLNLTQSSAFAAADMKIKSEENRPTG